ncbi:MAG TPA: WYL domain-containing protein [Candidatus Acidoferrum sp.]|nr:WYL domain-containing protein [Candidatus Acidoferrum sp.]
MPRGDQLSRQWKLLHILAARGGRSIPALMRETGCSRRTVCRDLEILRAAGLPIANERDGRESRYRLVEGPRGLPPIPLSLPELMSLHMGRHLLVPLRGTPVGESIHAALEKIAATLAPGAKTFLDRLNEELSARTVQTKDCSGSQADLETLREAIHERRTIEVEYHSFGRDAVTRRRLNPLHLWVQQGGMYLAAFCHQRQEVRTFAVERFRHVRLTGDSFEVPAGFTLDRYLEGSLGLFRGNPIQVSLRFSREVARYVAERQWHPTQVTAPLLTGELDLTLKVPLSPELTRWILSYGKSVEVRQPASLREEIRREWLAALRGRGGRPESPQVLSRKTARS